MSWLRIRLIEAHLICDGPMVASGFIAPTEKRNKRPVIIPGWWAIRQCSCCHELYATPNDLLVPDMIPTADVVREFEEEYGGDLAA